MRNANLLAVTIIVIVLAGSARADAVTDWNAIAIQASLAAGGPPGPSARVGPTSVGDIAMVHVAIYDAVQAIEGKYQPFYVDIPNASGSPVAATAKAAHDILVSLYPGQSVALGLTYQNYLLANGILVTDPGIPVGARAAAGIIALRACDGSFPDPPPPPFIGSTAIGSWRPTPPANAPMLGTWMANTVPFTLTRPTQFRSDPPPALTSREYAKDYAEVKAYGAATGSSRSVEQTDIANFWNSNFGVMLNRTMRDLSNEHVTEIADSSRLFAMATVSMADAIYSAWNDKVHYNVWRPITAIQNGHLDGNPATDGDPTWNSFATNPPYPDYVSGANAITAAAVFSMEHFFETEHMDISITTTNTGPTNEDTRHFKRFSDVSSEVVDARIRMGIHCRCADTAARNLGKNVAAWAHKNYFRPVGARN